MFKQSAVADGPRGDFAAFVQWTLASATPYPMPSPPSPRCQSIARRDRWAIAQECDRAENGHGARASRIVRLGARVGYNEGESCRWCERGEELRPLGRWGWTEYGAATVPHWSVAVLQRPVSLDSASAHWPDGSTMAPSSPPWTLSACSPLPGWIIMARDAPSRKGE